MKWSDEFFSKIIFAQRIFKRQMEFVFSCKIFSMLYYKGRLAKMPQEQDLVYTWRKAK